jgi:hypothetical protein
MFAGTFQRLIAGQTPSPPARTFCLNSILTPLEGNLWLVLVGFGSVYARCLDLIWCEREHAGG